MPVPKASKVVCTTTYQDVTLFHDLVTGHYVTGILHLLNQTQFTGSQNAKALFNLSWRLALPLDL
jgi:hypothetical protein